MQSVSGIQSCYIGPQISPEQFIAEHIFIYLVNGTLIGFDGHTQYSMSAGEYCIARKNHLARYSKQKNDGQFAKVVVIFDEPFLKAYQQKHKIIASQSTFKGSFIKGEQHSRIQTFVSSLAPYYNGEGKIDEMFADIKREELLLTLLKIDPSLTDIFFDFGIPERIDIEVFMNKNYKFNVSVERFAYLTGRSVSTFKRDFKTTFNDTPSHWLIKKRLQEAYFQMDKKGKKATEIYLELGFEDLSHFSFAFKKLFGVSPKGLGL